MSGLLLFTGCATAPVPSPSAAPPASPPLAVEEPGEIEPPLLPREFRGVWVATVANIDWPSRPGLPAAQQQAELLAMLDRAAALNLNAVILQVRPAADALYASPHEPWSEYLTGAMGRAPEPLYDPLEFAVQEAHRRGLELHAWFNPYRARHPSARSEISADHISRTRPELVRTYGSYLWMDPGEETVQDHSLRVILDVVRRYEIDGVHIDDYFYPYPERDTAGNLLDFPDEPSWTRHLAAGGRLTRADWRRQNVDRFIERLYREIKREKPWVKFGISPFGIWRPGYPPQIRTGFDQYAQLYADARKWLVLGWMDYFTPQLYWPIAQTPQSYPVLLRWWVEQNREQRHLWPGNFTNRVMYGDRPFWPAREVLAQVYVTRGQVGATGNVHFSMRVLMQNPDSLVEKLSTEAYAQPALPPASRWLWGGAPGRPRVRVLEAEHGRLRVVVEPTGRTLPTWWVVRTRLEEGWTVEVVPAFGQPYERAWTRQEDVPREIGISAVDRVGNEGPVQVLRPGG
ncbi:MAG TPA: family 10 glycosylhydrolase [Longimicrobiaceae bacterium]|nr:family 10 glycosylhydrolase [Longimicrobiaceae bacterium]